MNLNKINIKMTIYVNLMGITQEIWGELLFANSDPVYGKAFKSTKILKSLQSMKKAVLIRLKWCKGQTFSNDRPDLACEIMNELAQIQDYIRMIPVESERPAVQISFNQFNFLVRQLVYTLENNTVVA